MALSEREQAFENQFKHDQEIKFRIEARRAKLFGLWVAEQLDMPADEAETYARSVVDADLEEPGSEDILRKVAADLEAGNVEISEHKLRRTIDEFLERATREVMEQDRS